MKTILLLYISVIAVPLFIQGQNLPETDIYLAEIRINPTNVYFGGARNITARKGYDNQPCFINDSVFLYTSIREDRQSDIYQYNVNRSRISKLTVSLESEYSAKPIPHKAGFSVVLVEKDSTQRLWAYQKNGIIKTLVHPDFDSLGYYCWTGDQQFAAMVISNPPVLKLFNIHDGTSEVIATGIGRSMQMSADGYLYFTQMSDSVRWLCRRERNGEISRLIEFFKGTEDFVISRENLFFTAKGGDIYFSTVEFNKGWRLCSNFSKAGLKNIQRLALSPDQKRMAFVEASEIKP